MIEQGICTTSKQATTQQKEKPAYVDTLDPISKSRYFHKISAIGGIDPYQTATKDWAHDPKDFPDLSYPDIFNYLAHAKSAYTFEDFKNYKSLEAYNNFVCGWMKDVRYLWSSGSTSGNVVITGKARHSQRMNDPLLHPWVICRKSGEVLSAHCTCMAGLGEACSHVGALLFWVDSAVKIRDSTTVTQVPAYWMIPSSTKSVPYKEVQDINFRSAKTMKRILDADIAGAQCEPKKQSTPATKPDVPPSTSEDLAAFAKVLHRTGDKAVLLSVFPEYCKHYIPTSLGDAYPQVLSELHDEKLEGLPCTVGYWGRGCTPLPQPFTKIKNKIEQINLCYFALDLLWRIQNLTIFKMVQESHYVISFHSENGFQEQYYCH